MSIPNPGDGRVYNFAALREELDLVAGDENLPRSRQMAVAPGAQIGARAPLPQRWPISTNNEA